MTRIHRRPFVHALLFAPLLAMMASVATLAPAEDMSLLHIEVDRDVGRASAWIYIDGEAKGAIGPGCALTVPVDPGRHQLEYVWQGGAVSQAFTVLQNEVVRALIKRGPEIIMAPADSPLGPVCA